jgi:hypothetical protein
MIIYKKMKTKHGRGEFLRKEVEYIVKRWELESIPPVFSMTQQM